MIFKKPEPSTNGDNARPQPQRQPRLQAAIHEVDTAIQALLKVTQIFSTIAFDAQKIADGLQHTRDSWVKTLGEAGGEIEQEPIEEHIRDFIPKAIQREPQQ